MYLKNLFFFSNFFSILFFILYLFHQTKNVFNPNPKMSMKKFLFLVMALGVAVSSFAQYRAVSRAKVIAPVNKVKNIDLPVVGQQPPNSYVSNKSIMDDPVTAITRYDMQSNTSNERRIYLYPDGTIGTTATWSTQDVGWTDRGTGYNYFDGTAWGAQPVAGVEAIRTGWPSYHPFGATGELIISHQATGDLVMNTRPVKGTGTWTETILPDLPSTITGMLWPRAVTNGTNHTNIHIIAVTMPTGNGGQVYNGMDGALLYCRSLDGGVTFSDWAQLPGTTSAEYISITADIYAFAEPKGDTLAFTVGDSNQDQFLMKSTDNGTTWTKTIIYNSPYNLGGTSPGWYYCPDATMAVALDNQGIAHVVFGLQQDSLSSAGGYYNILAEGIVYWNENMPQLDQSLDPNILIPNHQYVAWVKDLNLFNLPQTQLTYWFTSQTSNPELVIDKNNKVFLAWAGGTSLVDANNYNLRHIYGRDGYIDGDTIMWHNDTLVDITGDWIQYNFADCYYPSASPTSDAYVYILFQKDDYGGCYLKSTLYTGTFQGQTAPDDNSITLIKWQKPIWVGINEQHEKPTFSIGQNYPNPATGLTKVNVYMQNSGDLSLKVTNLTGQTLMSMEKTNVHAGVNEFVIDANQLSSGIYFYTVKQGDKSITKKMIVQ